MSAAYRQSRHPWTLQCLQNLFRSRTKHNWIFSRCKNDNVTFKGFCGKGWFWMRAIHCPPSSMKRIIYCLRETHGIAVASVVFDKRPSLYRAECLFKRSALLIIKTPGRRSTVATVGG